MFVISDERRNIVLFLITLSVQLFITIIKKNKKPHVVKLGPLPVKTHVSHPDELSPAVMAKGGF